MDPEHANARQRLGYRRESGSWLTSEEFEETRKLRIRGPADLGKWLTKFRTLFPEITEPGTRDHERVVKVLNAIDDPAAIPAMEQVLAGHSELPASLMVEALGHMTAHEASGALARQAVFSPWDSVRQAAVRCLQAQDLERCVPPLLAMVSTPILTEAEIYNTSRGGLMYRYTFYREAQYHTEKAVFDTEYLNSQRSNRRNGLAARMQRDMAGRARGVDATVAARNAAIAQINTRACQILSQLTGETLEASPESWWQWWNNHNEVYLVGSKPVQETYRKDKVKAYRQPNVNLATFVARPRPDTGDCLAAGTPVWTDSGPVAIEQIKIGDRVLSQDPENGCLAYRPVLRTTVRPPGQLVRIVFGQGFVQCSGGHPFWISGKGWVKARDLEDGTWLHTVDGTVGVLSVYPVGTEETYNLIVADSHAYFVTEAMILSHDNTIRDLTNAVVPGLVDP